MNRFEDLSLWVDVAAILLVGVLIFFLISRAVRLLATQAQLEPTRARPIRILLRWAGILVIVGLVVNRVFAVDFMSLILGGLALVAIGVVAVWSLLSHITATILLILLKPFRMDDWIGFAGEDVAGKVTDLNLFHTILVNEESNEHFIIPNNMFFQKTTRFLPRKGQGAIELSEHLGPAQVTGPKAGEN